ncbi:IPT/TIG domain-containing protein [Streptomyces sp. NPDC008222]|uniref:IPT/TIG domain-containing protein n=1 Tax=Streptomyces sp. NPDC008222 TaxID=3364820 RepID=UPI0036E700E7
MSPSQGSTAGGTLVTFTGTNLVGTSAVTFGTKPATGITQVSPTQVTAVSPAGSGAVLGDADHARRDQQRDPVPLLRATVPVFLERCFGPLGGR